MEGEGGKELVNKVTLEWFSQSFRTVTKPITNSVTNINIKYIDRADKKKIL